MFTADAVNSYDAGIAALDPLAADHLMAQLPKVNAAAAVSWLVETTNGLAQRAWAIDTPAGACAAIRDLGFLVSSIGRHRPAAIEPCRWAPELLRLARLADEVPRDTVYSYATRNPTGARRRTFTGADEEHLFITSVTDGIAHLNLAVEVALDFISVEPGVCDEALVVRLDELGAHLREFAACLLAVKRAVTPEFFTGRLRPYFPPIRLGGDVLYGPGGAQMPQLVLDVVLLRPSRAAPLATWHDEYVHDNATYLPRCYRDLIDAANKRPSGLVARLAAPDAPVPRDATLPAALRKAVETVLRFRYPHQQLARANMNVRPPGSVGSGGYDIGAVNELVNLTSYALNLLNAKAT